MLSQSLAKCNLQFAGISKTEHLVYFDRAPDSLGALLFYQGVFGMKLSTVLLILILSVAAYAQREGGVQERLDTD